MKNVKNMATTIEKRQDLVRNPKHLALNASLCAMLSEQILFSIDKGNLELTQEILSNIRAGVPEKRQPGSYEVKIDEEKTSLLQSLRQQTDFAKYRQIKLEGENQIKDTLYPKYFADNTTNLEKIELPSKEEYDFILNILLGLEKGVDKKVKIAHSSCEIGLDDGNIAGGKNKSLCEMINNLAEKGVPVPDLFNVSCFAYRQFITPLTAELESIFSDLDIKNIDNLNERGLKSRNLLLNTPFSQEIEDEITLRYLTISLKYNDKSVARNVIQRLTENLPKNKGDLLAILQEYVTPVDVAVRSSASAEDLPDASFAGQQETYLNVRGVNAVIEATHKCFASIFTDRAICYRQEYAEKQHAKGEEFDVFKVDLAVGVQKMVRSDLASSGVMFSIDTETGFKNAVTVTGAYGLGENVVQGAVNPDEWTVFKHPNGNSPILRGKINSKKEIMVYAQNGETDENGKLIKTKNLPAPREMQKKFCLSNKEVEILAKYARIIEEHYTQERGGLHTPMDIEWAKDGITGELFIVQARPETVESQKNSNVLVESRLIEELKESPILTGTPVGSLVGNGKTRVVKTAEDMRDFKQGEVLVAKKTDPDMEPIMKKASAIVTDAGGRTCHAAIIAREMGIPAVVGCGNATEVLSTGQEVTVVASKGKVYNGKLDYETIKTDISNIEDLRQEGFGNTKVYVNIGNPEDAFEVSQSAVDGVGLARSEHVILNHIKIHPLALLHYDKLKDSPDKDKIAELTEGYDNKSDFFVDELASGIGTIAAAFYPRPVIVRMSDFKSNEFANLLGANGFEPTEENPMIGWRGAVRYYDPGYVDAFRLECKAHKRVRDEMGLTNTTPMIPFCRTPEELKKVLAIMEEEGLQRGVNELKVYVMAEVPSNVLLAERFLELCDGYSIGSNDLTQLTLGLDRDSALVSHLFDETNPAVLGQINNLIELCNSMDKYIGICGQAPSDYPELAKHLIDKGISSISFNKDVIVKTIINIAKLKA